MVAVEGIIIHDNPGVRPRLPIVGEFCCIFLRRHPPGARLVVADVNRRHTSGNQIIPLLMPNPLPSVEEVA
jgi:hypothetical protein